MKALFKRPLGVVLVLAAILALPFSARSEQPARPNGVPPRWNFLQNSYWYVPEANLPALLSTTAGGGAFAPISDQTVFFIERYAGGYFWEVVATQFTLGAVSIGPNCFQLVGSVTPEGTVNLAFTPAAGGTATAGFGTMVKVHGHWEMENQMSTGTTQGRVTHWAYMTQCVPSQPCARSLPGTDLTIAQMIAACS
jgi:hypothetical protein